VVPAYESTATGSTTAAASAAGGSVRSPAFTTGPSAGTNTPGVRSVCARRSGM